MNFLSVVLLVLVTVLFILSFRVWRRGSKSSCHGGCGCCDQCKLGDKKEKKDFSEKTRQR